MNRTTYFVLAPGLIFSVLSIIVCMISDLKFVVFAFFVAYWLYAIVIIPMYMIDYIYGLLSCLRDNYSSYEKKPCDLGRVIGSLERTLIYLIVISQWYISGLKVLESMVFIVLGVIGIKSIYRFEAAKKKEDWIIIGTLLSVILGTIFSLVAIAIVTWIQCL